MPFFRRRKTGGSGSGVLFPFFASFMGWLGVALTGSEASSNACFANLRKVIRIAQAAHG